MSEPTESRDTARVKPTGRAFLDAKREVAERNERAQKAGKAERDAHERQAAARRRAQTDVYR